LGPAQLRGLFGGSLFSPFSAYPLCFTSYFTFFCILFWVAALLRSYTLHFRYPYTPHPRYPRRLSTIPIPLLSAASAAASHFPPSFLPSGFLCPFPHPRILTSFIACSLTPFLLRARRLRRHRRHHVPDRGLRRLALARRPRRVISAPTPRADARTRCRSRLRRPRGTRTVNTGRRGCGVTGPSCCCWGSGLSKEKVPLFSQMR
jgi:hypothetical protein